VNNPGSFGSGLRASSPCQIGKARRQDALCLSISGSEICFSGTGVEIMAFFPGRAKGGTTGPL